MSAQDFIGRVLDVEGGYVNDPGDAGGETNLGITWPMLHDAVAKGVVPNGTTIRGLTRDQANAIYFEMVWKAGNMDQLPPALAYQFFDTAVNSGLHEASVLLQRAANVTADGVIGEQTMAAISRLGPQLACRFVAERITFMTGNPTWARFGRGWMLRIAANLRYLAADA